MQYNNVTHLGRLLVSRSSVRPARAGCAAAEGASCLWHLDWHNTVYACMCICVYVCICIYIYIYTHTYEYLSLYIYIYMCISIDVCITCITIYDRCICRAYQVFVCVMSDHHVLYHNGANLFNLSRGHPRNSATGCAWQEKSQQRNSRRGHRRSRHAEVPTHRRTSEGCPSGCKQKRLAFTSGANPRGSCQTWQTSTRRPACLLASLQPCSSVMF